MPLSRYFARSVSGLLVLATSFMVLGCDSGPRRTGPKTYAEYKEARFGVSVEVDDGVSSDDGEFGPSSGDMPTLSADAIASAGVSNAGSIKGVVKFTGKVRPRTKFDLSKDKWCADNHEVIDESVVVASDGGIQNVVVYVSRGFNRFEFDPPTTPAVLNQQGCKYIPHVLTLMAGQPLEVKNSDNTSHNYHYIGQNDEINKTQPEPTVDLVSSLTKPDLNSSFRCDIHGWMNAPTRIFSHPYYALTDEKGAFEIKNLPPGNYEVSFLHERKSIAYAPQTVTVSAGQAATLAVQ